MDKDDKLVSDITTAFAIFMFVAVSIGIGYLLFDIITTLA